MFSCIRTRDCDPVVMVPPSNVVLLGFVGSLACFIAGSFSAYIGHIEHTNSEFVE